MNELVNLLKIILILVKQQAKEIVKDKNNFK